MKHRLRIPDDIDFWQNVNIRGLDDCWYYRGKNENARQKVPPVQISRKVDGEHKTFIAYRVAYKYAEGLFGRTGLLFVDIHHTCKDPMCVNPNHLEADDEAVAHLTAEEIDAIRRSSKNRIEIMEEYGIEEPRFIGFIKNGNQ